MVFDVQQALALLCFTFRYRSSGALGTIDIEPALVMGGAIVLSLNS